LNVGSQHISAIGQLIDKDLGFVLYRLPSSTEPTLIVSGLDYIEKRFDYADLNGCEGFVLAPFHIESLQPILIIHPEQVIEGFEGIDSFIHSQAFEHWLSVPKSTGESLQCKQGAEEEKKTYKGTFHRFLDALDRKQFDKLVLSRYHVEQRDETIAPVIAFLRACKRYSSAFVYLCYTPISGLWMGSSPEVLLSGTAPDYHTVALAGTMRVNDSPRVIRWDVKNRNEQQWVVTYLREVLSENGTQWQEDPAQTMVAGNVAHLKTLFHFRYHLSQQLGELLKKMHPTPAVCGFPKEQAYRFIVENEGYNRSYYAGFVGLLSPVKQTDLYVNLRCMRWEEKQLILYAGGGLLVTSQVEKEWRETEYKLQTMLRILHEEND
jgi:isochorismate synthase